MSRLVIGLTGAAGAGKDTAANLLEDLLLDRHGEMLMLAFATPLRDMLRPLLRAAGAKADVLFDREAKERALPLIGASPRRLMQTLGTEWGRQLISSTLWIDLARRSVEREPDIPAVFTDVRFADEATFIRSLGGEVWRIVRNVDAIASHISEAGLPDALIDRQIDNTGSLDALHTRLAYALELAGAAA